MKNIHNLFCPQLTRFDREKNPCVRHFSQIYFFSSNPMDFSGFLSTLTQNDALALSSLAMTVSGLAAAVALLSGLSAPYGRYALARPALASAYSLGVPMVPARAAWLLQECPSFLVASYILWRSALPPSLLWTTAGLLCCLFLAHYFNRGFIYPLRLQGGKPTPLGIGLMAFVFCLWNGCMQGVYLASLAGAAGAEPPAAVLAPRFACGVLLFLAGMGINLQADDILRNLRRPGETGYKIPHGGAFNWVSGANFLGECIEWAGFALAAYQPYQGAFALPWVQAACSQPGLALLCNPAVAFMLFTWCNIGPRALQHHANYQEMFKGKYPKERKALIPWLL